MKKLLSVLFALLLLLSGCSRDQEQGVVNFGQTTTTDAQPVAVDFSKTDADMFTQRDQAADYDKSKAVTIQLKETTASASSDSVQISGSKITITQEATYVLSGKLTDGMVIVDAEDTAKVQLVLAGVDITSKTSAALYVLQGDKVFVTLAQGTENNLQNGGSFTAIDDNNIDGAVFSKQDLTFNGPGKLTVTSPAGHGIVCKDDLVITGGSYAVSAASHGLDANDSVRLGSADLTVDAGKDAIHCENTEDATKGFVYISGATVQAEAEGDGIAASSYLQFADGTVDLLVGGGAENGTKASSGNYGGFKGGGGKRPGSQQSTVTTEDAVSMKGLKAANSMLISGGKITVNSADDAIHSDVSITVNGGSFTLATGDDAIHAEESLTVTAGKIDISQSYEGLEALHIYVQGGDITLKASDDGLNAAGGADQSGITGGRDGMFGGGFGAMGGGRPGGGGGGGMSANSNGSIVISGGTLNIQSSGDGLDANGTLEISGGHTTVAGPTRGDTATLDYDKTGIITGGTFIGTGASGMAQSFSDSEQGVIGVNAGNQSAGTQILLKDEKGSTIFRCTPPLDFAVVILSDPQLEKGKSYQLTIGSQTETVTAN